MFGMFFPRRISDTKRNKTRENAMTALTRLFITHPQSVDESYFEHMRFAGGFSAKLFAAAFAALAHAVLPFLFEKTASRMIAELHARTAHRGKHTG